MAKGPYPSQRTRSAGRFAGCRLYGILYGSASQKSEKAGFQSTCVSANQLVKPICGLFNNMAVCWLLIWLNARKLPLQKKNRAGFPYGRTDMDFYCIAGSRSAEERHGVHRCTVDVHLEMQVIPGGIAGGADVSDELPSLDLHPE